MTNTIATNGWDEVIVIIAPNDSHRKRGISDWLSGLTRDEVAEYVGLNRSFDDAFTDERLLLAEIAQDWVEEHGGEREWWYYTGLLEWPDDE